MRYPPKIDPEKLDFSEFHPLDHRPWEARCLEFYGGRRRHVRMWWDFFGKPQLRAKTWCRLGRHRPGTAFWPQQQVMFQSCRSCHKRLGPNQPMDQL